MSLDRETSPLAREGSPEPLQDIGTPGVKLRKKKEEDTEYARVTGNIRPGKNAVRIPGTDFLIEKLAFTPDVARHFHNNLGPNRNHSEHTVTTYSDDMERGEFPITGNNNVLVGTDGLVYDGKHRIKALLQSGATIDLLVVYNVPLCATKYIDLMRARSLSDSLQIERKDKNMKRKTVVVTAINLVLVGTFLKMSRSIMEGLLDLMENAVNYLVAQGSVPKHMKSAPVLAAFALAYQKNPILVDEFFQQVRVGADKTKPQSWGVGHPAHTLREWLISNPRLTDKEGGRRVITLKTLYAIDSALNRRRIRSLKIDEKLGEQYANLNDLTMMSPKGEREGAVEK